MLGMLSRRLSSALNIFIHSKYRSDICNDLLDIMIVKF